MVEHAVLLNSGPKVIRKVMLNLTMKFRLLIKSNVLKNKDFLAYDLSGGVFIMLINVNMPINVSLFDIYEQNKFHAQLS